MQFRPTLIIGLGGSGTFVARRLKKRLFRLVESEIPPSIQILAFDTDRQSPDPLLDDLSPAEFHRINDFQGDNFVSETALKRQPELKDWWNYTRLVPGFVRDGAKQKPPVGRLAFFVKFNVIEKQVRDSIQRMFQRTPSYIPIPNVNSVDLYVVGSSCGGTGAGMFFDMAILARSIIRNAGHEAALQAHVFLPSCFEHTPADLRSLQANAFAFFRTMEAMQSGSLSGLRYPSGMIENPAKYLFNRVHLLSSVNTAGIKLEDAQEVFETTSLQLDLEISQAAGHEMRTAVDNAAANFDSRPLGRLAVYSSYGSAHLAGTPDLGRLAALPDFVRSITSILTSPSKNIADGGAAITNPAFIHLGTILRNDTAALNLLPNYEDLAGRIRRTPEPESMALELTARLDSVLAGLSTDGLNSLGSLTSEARETACRMIQNGDAGISKAIDYLDRAKQELGHILGLAGLAEAAQSESASSIVGRINQFFKTKDSKKTDLISKGLPYLRDQSLVMVRKSFALKSKADLSTASGELQSYLDALHRFAGSANALLATVEKESRDKIAAKRNILGTQSIAIDIEEVKKSFAKKAGVLATEFFISTASGRSLRRLAEGVLDGKGSDIWGANLLQSADEFLRVNLAADAAVPSNWYERAAQQIVGCQPLVQFDHARYVRDEPTKIAIARAYASVGVKKAVQSCDPSLNLQIGDSSEPGSLEVTAVVLNFALHELQELRMIEEGFNYWKKAQPQPWENRYAWRGPKAFWERLLQTGIFPLSDEKQALARVLAFSPLPQGQMTPIAIQRAESYSINGRNLEIDSDFSRYEKYERFNTELLSTGWSEKLVQTWADADPAVAKNHAESLITRVRKRIADATEREGVDHDWQRFIDMLSEELVALEEAVRRLSV